MSLRRRKSSTTGSLGKENNPDSRLPNGSNSTTSGSRSRNGKVKVEGERERERNQTVTGEMTDEEPALLQPSRRKRSRISDSQSRPSSSSQIDRRVSSQSASAMVRDDDSEEERQSGAASPLSLNGNGPPNTLNQRDNDGFLPGSIVRMALKNFVTYEDVEFFPCPHLNMIIGPNGTGKSSLVCALALGLGYPPSVLDRAPQLKLYIKHGETEGSIEIELKGFRNQKNRIVKLLMHSSNNTRIFEIDGVKSTLASVQELVRSFNIQIDNLCCFLPQEKVSKFAEMKEPELLKETQKVAGHKKLSAWHQSLITHGQKKIEYETKLNIYRKEYQSLQKQVENMQADVDRLEERKKFEKKVRIYELLLQSKIYDDYKLKCKEAKAKHTQQAEKVLIMEEKLRPMEKQKALFKNLTDEYQNFSNQLNSKIQKSQSDAVNCQSNYEVVSKKFFDASEKLSSLKDDERKQKELRIKLEREVQELSEKVKRNVEVPDLAPFEEEIKTLSGQIREVSRKISSLKDRQADIYKERDTIANQQKELHKEIQNLRSVSSRQEGNIQQHVPKLFQALQIMREFQRKGKFRAKVYEPIRLVISPKSPRFAQALEGALSMDLLNTFVCTDPEDYEMLATEFNDNQKLRVSIACLAAGDSLANYQPPVPAEEIKSMGFDNYLIDLIEGPDQVLAYICQQSRLHLIPVSHTQGTRVNESKLEDRNFPIKVWIIGSTRFSVSFSSYGSRALLTKSAEIPRAKILLMGAVDEKLIQDKMEGIRELEATATSKQDALEKLKAEETELREMHTELSNEKKGAESRKKVADEAHVQHLKDKANYARKAQELKKERDKPKIDEERKRRKDVFKRLSRELLEVFKKVKENHCQISQFTTALVSLELLLIQHEADHRAFNRKLQAKQVEVSEEKELLSELNSDKNQVHQEARTVFWRVRELLAQAPEEIRLGLQQLTEDAEFKEKGVEEMTELLAHEREELELMHPVDASVIERYDTLKGKMESEKVLLENKETELEEITGKIKKVYDLWRPRLDELIQNVDEKFDLAFKRIGCLGHVKIVEDPDYDKWGIEIQVSFRDGNPLMRLDAQRQSGGERSLSTIMYFMSLTELGKAPFSLVDEINQGMDREYERAVHDQLVEITCRNDASQYFLITPKLLLGLRYHPLMRVLFVNNGDWLPQGFKLGPSLLKAKERIKMKRKK